MKKHFLLIGLIFALIAAGKAIYERFGGIILQNESITSPDTCQTVILESGESLTQSFFTLRDVSFSHVDIQVSNITGISVNDTIRVTLYDGEHRKLRNREFSLEKAENTFVRVRFPLNRLRRNHIYELELQLNGKPDAEIFVVYSDAVQETTDIVLCHDADDWRKSFIAGYGYVIWNKVVAFLVTVVIWIVATWLMVVEGISFFRTHYGNWQTDKD